MAALSLSHLRSLTGFSENGDGIKEPMASEEILIDLHGIPIALVIPSKIKRGGISDQLA